MKQQKLACLLYIGTRRRSGCVRRCIPRSGQGKIPLFDRMGEKRMNILFFQWHSFMNQGMERALQKLDIKYDTFFYQFQDWEKDDVFLEQFGRQLKNGRYDAVLSVNFSPLISLVCEQQGMKYIAWVYDSPVHIRDLSSMKNSCNQIYFFDRGQAEEYRRQGIDAKYTPLAVDTEVFGQTVAKTVSGKYETDISLVGKLYRTEYQHFTAPLSGYLKGYLEGIVNSQMKIYGGYLIPELITKDLLAKMNEDYRRVSKDSFQMGGRELEFLLACETTGRERYLALSLLSGHYRVDVYSTDQDERLKNVKYRGYADYYKEMPGIFCQSRINLNISLKTVRTGIPLRVVDIMGCGGFVLSNYQEELLEHFIPGEECAVYENLEDMYQKAAYYLWHEGERKRIAAAGFEKVKRDFTFEERLSKMLLGK